MIQVAPSLLVLVELLMLLAGAFLYAAREWRWRARQLRGRRILWLSALLCLPAPARFLLGAWLLNAAQSPSLARQALRQLELALVIIVVLLATALIASAPRVE